MRSTLIVPLLAGVLLLLGAMQREEQPRGLAEGARELLGHQAGEEREPPGDERDRERDPLALPRHRTPGFDHYR